MTRKNLTNDDAPFNGASSAVLTPANDNDFNPDDYLSELDDWDISEEQKREILLTLWNILCTFVDIGWGVDTVQHFLPALFEKAGRDSENTVQIVNNTDNEHHNGGEHE